MEQDADLGCTELTEADLLDVSGGNRHFIPLPNTTKSERHMRRYGTGKEPPIEPMGDVSHMGVKKGHVQNRVNRYNQMSQ